MEIIKNIDLLLDKQPEKHFIELLSTPVHQAKPEGFKKRKIKKDEVLFDKINLITNFPDKNNDLEYAYKDFLNFLRSVDIKEDKNGVYLKFKHQTVEKDNPEAFILDVNKDGATVIADHVDGVRRALIFIEDQMKRRCGPYLPKGKTDKIPFVKTRISRCFFTPPSHASAEGSINELCSDTDYYPEEYLNRLSHDGINGLWIGSSFRKMLKSDIITEYGTEQDVQIKKLNQIVAKCKKFGIGIYLFVTEPASSCYNKEIFDYPDMLGPTTPDNFTLLCPSQPKVQAYIKESVTKLFTLVPDLAGLINITVGESLSGCGSTDVLFCPRCKENYKTLGATLAATEKMFSDAMKEVAPNAKFISWTYAQRESKFDSIEDACRLRDEGVIHMQNFEDLGTPVQLGKKRLAYDYWLSYPGPGELMKFTTKINKERNIRSFAKIQVCSSHEISTVPYVPVPGILYDKYKYMYENGISGVMQCWYFGNYPSLMNKSAFELSYAPFFTSKTEFLTYLAKTYFGKDYKNAVIAWKFFEKGYKNFPVNLAFEWVGPMQDSPCCPLHLLPIDWPMPGTWLKSEQSGGDRIGECLLNGHSIDEAITLINAMCEYWNKGLKFITAINSENSEVRDEQKRIATAISLIFKSGLNILKFYKLRHVLGTRQGGLEILRQMESIVFDEIQISTELIPLCEKDIRIGYHSEANGYKIFPEKLRWRIDKLKELLNTEFIEVEKRITDDKIPLKFYYGLNDGSVRKVIKNTPNQSDWSYFYLENGKIDKNTALRVYENENGCHIQIKTNDISDQIKIKPEFNVMFPTIPIYIMDGELVIESSNSFSVPSYKTKTEERKFKFNSKKSNDEFIHTITFDRKTLNMQENEPFRLGIWRTGKINSTLLKATKCFSSQLIRGEFSPEHYCFFVKD